MSVSAQPPQAAQGAATGIELIKAFINTAEFEEGTDDLETADQARAWLQAQELIGGEPLTESQRLRLVEAREALRALIAAGHGGSIDPGGLAILDGVGRSARLTIAFSGDGSAVLHPDATGVDRALGRIVAAVYAAMVDGGWARLKICGNDACSWAFHDQSKNRSAKWCSMQSCGNRMKARAFRARREAEA